MSANLLTDSQRFRKPEVGSAGPPHRDRILSLLSPLAMAVGFIAPYSRPHVWFEAKIDGRLVVPLDKDQQNQERTTPFLKELEQHYNTCKQEAKEKYEKTEGEIRKKTASLTKAISDWKEHFDSKVKEPYAEAAEKMKELIDACSSHKHMSHVLYVATVVLLIILDFPTQAAAFVVSLDENWRTWAYCAGIAILTGFLGHFVGYLVNLKGIHYRAFAVGFCLILVMLFGGIAQVRMTNFERLFGVVLF